MELLEDQQKSAMMMEIVERPIFAITSTKSVEQVRPFTHFYFAFAYNLIVKGNLPFNSCKISKDVLNLYSIKLVYVERRTKHLLGS